MPVFHSSCVKSQPWILLVLCILITFSTVSANSSATNVGKSEETGTGRILGFLKPKHDYTDINLGFQIPVPETIPYPIYKIGYQNLFPFKTWLTINPVHILQALYKLGLIGYEFATRLWLILWNTIDVFKLWAAFIALNKHHKHGGWHASTADYFEGGDSWRR